MLLIKKQGQPKTLSDAKLNLKRTPDVSMRYDSLHADEIGDILDDLLAEQGYLCAYCMRRISRKGAEPHTGCEAHIEHYLPRHPTDALRESLGAKAHYDADKASLDYANLFAVCDGGQSDAAHGEQCCDKSRSLQEMLAVNPCNEQHMRTISYSINGFITSPDPAIRRDLNEQLNLNSEKLSFPENRKRVIGATDAWAASLKGGHRSRKAQCEAKLMQYEQADRRAMRIPFAGVAIWRLRFWIRRFS